MPTLRFNSVNPDKDPVVKWFKDLGFWGPKIKRRIIKSSLFLTRDLVTEFRNDFNLPLDEKTKELFRSLIEEMNGVNLKCYEYPPVTQDGNTVIKPWLNKDVCVGKLYNLHLVRVQEDENLLKPYKVLFEPMVQHLTGFKALPIL